jgi:hypothetical protein
MMIKQSSTYTIAHYVRIHNTKAEKDNAPLLSSAQVLPADEWYRLIAHPYLKFFKMDILCKWAWIGAELLLSQGDSFVYDNLDKTKIGLVFTTAHGCIDVDKKYLQTVETIPSPALFVYTLPNIMLGEICIRHGFKGEQLSMIADRFDSEEMVFAVNDMLDHKSMDACFCGWVDVTNENVDLHLAWVTKQNRGVPFSAKNLQDLYNK